jgi:DNA polymerase/3'-5' exonuclease PolX
MKLKEAEEIANELINYFRPVCEKIEVVGSIKRRKPEPKDIDIILIPKENRTFNMLIDHLKGADILKRGVKIIELRYRNIQVDLYNCTKENYEVIRLIRIGSEFHNIKLCTIARRKGWTLHSDGRGLFDEHDKLISNTEEGILIALLGKVIPPEERK